MIEAYYLAEHAPTWEAENYLPPEPELPDFSFQAARDAWMAKNAIFFDETE